MSIRRLVSITTVPRIVGAIFKDLKEPVSSEEKLWRERAARMTLDALGHTNLTVKPKRHNEAVRYARRWFRGHFADAPVPYTDNPEATFDFAGIDGFHKIRDAVLVIVPLLFPNVDDNVEDDDDEEAG